VERCGWGELERPAPSTLPERTPGPSPRAPSRPPRRRVAPQAARAGFRLRGAGARPTIAVTRGGRYQASRSAAGLRRGGQRGGRPGRGGAVRGCRGAVIVGGGGGGVGRRKPTNTNVRGGGGAPLSGFCFPP